MGSLFHSSSTPLPVPFDLRSDYQPQGDQGQAIEKLVRSIRMDNRHQTLLGVTGSGKTFTAANIIRELDRPTLVMSHNKTLAAQLYSEFKQFFPNNAVEYFVSYFDYYQPEAYIPRSDTYIEKDSSINEEIERLRLSTTSSLLTRRDVIVVSSVSCIYGLAFLRCNPGGLRHRVCAGEIPCPGRRCRDLPGTERRGGCPGRVFRRRDRADVSF